MSILYEGRIDSWSNPTAKILLFIPYINATSSMGRVRNVNIQTATQNYSQYFDHTYTYFVGTNALKLQYETLGFTNVISLEGYNVNNPLKIYLSESKHIDLFPNSTPNNTPQATYYENNTQVISGILGNWTVQSNAAATLQYFNVQQTGGYGFICYDINLNTELFTMNDTINSVYLTPMLTFWEGITPYIPSTDPFAPGGESEPGGGTGDFDGSSDSIDFPDLPNLSATDTGFITLFNPSGAQLKALANYMWSNSLFDVATWKKIFADPMDAILGLSIVPVAVPDGGTSAVSVGNISTDVSMTLAASQYVEIDCGTLNVNEYWGAYLDYEPFTKAEIYLPYIGTHAISIDDIMGKAVHVVYHVDILSGACAAYVKCGDSVLYTFIGQCAASVPITGNDWTNVINGVISAAAAIGTMVATGGASAPLAVPALANTAVNGMKPSIEKSGSLAGTGGMLGIQTPYLILTRPNQCLPAGQNEYMGYPSFISRNLGEITGYTEIEQVHLDGISATDAEIQEIESLLKSGVIF